MKSKQKMLFCGYNNKGNKLIISAKVKKSARSTQRNSIEIVIKVVEEQVRKIF